MTYISLYSRGKRVNNSISYRKTAKSHWPSSLSLFGKKCKEVTADQVYLVTIEINNHLSKLIFPQFVSPLAAAKNYTILKATGSKEVVNILGRTDGSGQYC